MTKGKNFYKTSGAFTKLAKTTAFAAGQPWTFGIAVLTILGWALSGPLFGFSDTWQLVINTSTTIITFLMVFLIQNTQNRDSQALHLKLDELLRATHEAHTAVMDIEELTDRELCEIKVAYTKLAQVGREKIRQGGRDTGIPNIVIETFKNRPKT